MLVAAIATLLALAQPARPFNEERQLLDRRLEALRRLLPDGPTAAADTALAREAAESARLARVEIQPRAPVESGRRGEVVLDFSALGGFPEIDGFFRKLERSPRLVDVESLTLTATAEDLIRIVAVLHVPYWPLRGPLPAAPESAATRTVGVPRPALDGLARDQALAFAKSEVVAERRRTRRMPRLFLAELAAACRERPVVVGFASLGDEFTVRGTVLGQAALRAFETRLERGFFRVSEFLIARQGACHRFEARGRSPVVGPEAALPLAGDDPFDDTAPCRADRDGPAERPIVVKGRAPTPKQPGKGPLVLRLRDVDLADVFQAVARLGLGGWVVDEAVTGRASVELVRATLDEALGALRRAARVDISEAGALRRVCVHDAGTRAPRQPTPRPDAGTGGSAARFWLKRTEVRDLLAGSAELDPSLASLGPPGFLGRLSVFTRDAPLLAVRAAVLEAASLSERTDQGRRVLERRTGGSEAPVPVARSGPEPRLTLRPEELSLDEFELAGVGSTGEGFLAFVYAPTGQLHAYAPGERLADAVVRSVDADGVTLETEEGPVRLSVPPLAN